MFKDEAQTHAAIRKLLRTSVSEVDRWWTEAGPTDQTWSLLEGRNAELSSGQALLLRVGVDLWNGKGGADFGRVFHGLDTAALAALGALLVAVTKGPDAIGAWIGNGAKR